MAGGSLTTGLGDTRILRAESDPLADPVSAPFLGEIVRAGVTACHRYEL